MACAKWQLLLLVICNFCAFANASPAFQFRQTAARGICAPPFQLAANFYSNRPRCSSNNDCAGNTRCCTLSDKQTRVCLQAIPIAQQPQIIEILPGSMQPLDGGRSFRFQGSSSVVVGPAGIVLFDVGGVWDQQKLMSNMRDVAGLNVEDIDYIIRSHGHPDHDANSNAFPNKKQLSGRFILDQGLFVGVDLSKPYYVLDDPNLEVIETPGHTNQDLSLVVRNTAGLGTVVLAGDSVLTAKDHEQPICDRSYDPTVCEASYKKIYCLANYIVPGHDNMFQVTPAMRQKYGC